TDEPPREGGGWSHDYCCPEDGARLRFRSDQPHKHLCPACNKEWEGPKLDAVWRGTVHSQFADAASDLALVYQLTGEERYGRAAARILCWYADHYADFPLGRGPAGRGKVMSQSLSECTWLITMMRAADLAWPVLTGDERVRIERDLVRAGAEHIHRFTFGIHNIQCWHNACYASAGYFLGDPDMIREARDGDLGFKNQVEKGIMEDGMWFERSMGYHSYTLNALVTHCEAARHAGENLHQLGRMRLMFTLPLRLAQPNLVVPSLNDQGYSRGTISPEPLERAVAWYQDD
ncbi:MAG: alginate lyase family protein, partial [Armatimonadota bacterium]|nr:alginate lyase family protein [Armatimonadota bacterium]